MPYRTGAASTDPHRPDSSATWQSGLAFRGRKEFLQFVSHLFALSRHPPRVSAKFANREALRTGVPCDVVEKSFFEIPGKWRTGIRLVHTLQDCVNELFIDFLCD